MNSKKIKYPISDGNIQCLSKCYPANKFVFHPITVEFVTSIKPFCLINEIQYKDKGINKTLVTDTCIKHKNIIDKSDNDTHTELFFNFDHVSFLKHYNIIPPDIVQGMVDWFEKNQLAPFCTKRRLLNIVLKTQHELFKSIIKKNNDCVKVVHINDEYSMSSIVTLFVEIAKKQWIKTLFNTINQYINIDVDGNISLHKKGSKSYDTKNYIEKINYIIDKFINHRFVEKFFIEWVKQHIDNWHEIDNYVNLIHDDLLIYIVKKIEATI